MPVPPTKTARSVPALSAYAYQKAASLVLAITGLMAMVSACIPLPSEVIMPFAGYLASTGRFNLILAATAGALGCNIGSTLDQRSAHMAADRWSSGGAATSCSARLTWTAPAGFSTGSEALRC